MKIGDSVKQVIHPIAGIVTRKQYDETSDGFVYLVEYTGADTEVTHRWFAENEIEEDASVSVAVIAPVVEPIAPETTTEGGV